MTSISSPQGTEVLRYLDEPVDSSLFATVARLGMPDAAKGMAFTADTASSHSLLIDIDPEADRNSSGPEPLELLLVALGSCTGLDVISILRKKRQVISHYSVNVYANVAPEYPKTYTYILVEHIVKGQNVDPRAVARSIELSVTKYCPVHALLARATRVEHVYRVLNSEAA